MVIGVGDGEVVGAAAGLGATVPTTAARATLRAVETLTEHKLGVVAADVAQLGRLHVALVAVTVGDEIVIGAATVGKRTSAEAFARAALDAVNRIISGSSDHMRRIRQAAVYDISL